MLHEEPQRNTLIAAPEIPDLSEFTVLLIIVLYLLLLLLLLLFVVPVVMVSLVQLRSRALDGDDATEDGVTQHGRHGEQHRQDLVTAFVRLVVEVTATAGVSADFPALRFWKKKIKDGINNRPTDLSLS